MYKKAELSTVTALQLGGYDVVQGALKGRTWEFGEEDWARKAR